MPRYRTTEIPEPVNERLFPGHNGWVWTIAISPDEKILAGGGAGIDPRIHLWDVSTGEVVGVLTGHTSSVLGLAFSPNGKRLYSMSYDGTLRAWDVATRTQVGKPLVETSSRFQHLAISQDGTLATGGEDRTFFILPPEGAKQVRLEGLPDNIRSFAFSKDGNTLAVGMENGHLRVLTRTSGSWQNPVDWRVEGGVRSLAFTPDGQHLVCGTDAGHLYKVEPASGSTPERLESIETHLLGRISSLLFADKDTLLVGQYDLGVSDGQRGNGLLAIVSWPGGAFLQELNDFWAGLDSLVLLGGGRHLITSKNRTPGLETPDRFSPACLDFGDVKLGRGRVGFKDAPNWLEV